MDKPVAMVPVRYEDQDLPVKSRRRVRIGVRKGESLTVVTDLPGEVEGPIPAGQRIGMATVRLNGEPFARVPLFAGRAVGKPSLIDRLMGNPLWIAGLLVLVLFAILAVLLLVRWRRERNARKRLQKVLRTRQ